MLSRIARRARCRFRRWSSRFRFERTHSRTASTCDRGTYRVNIKDFTGLLSALATQGKVNVLASPTVNALNNEPAIMRVGTQDVFFKTTTQTDAATGRMLHTTEPHVDHRRRRAERHAADRRRRHDQHEHLPSVTERTGEATSRFGDTVADPQRARSRHAGARPRQRNHRHCRVDGCARSGLKPRRCRFSAICPASESCFAARKRAAAKPISLFC